MCFGHFISRPLRNGTRNHANSNCKGQRTQRATVMKKVTIINDRRQPCGCSLYGENSIRAQWLRDEAVEIQRRHTETVKAMEAIAERVAVTRCLREDGHPRSSRTVAGWITPSGNVFRTLMHGC